MMTTKNRSQLLLSFRDNPDGEITGATVQNFVSNTVLPEDLVQGKNITIDKSALPAITISGGGGSYTVFNVADYASPNAAYAAAKASNPTAAQRAAVVFPLGTYTLSTDLTLDKNYEKLVVDYKGQYNNVWNNPRATPDLIVAAMGTKAQKLCGTGGLP